MTTTKKPRTKKPAIEYTHVLKVISKDRTSYGGFVWPTEGTATAPDWNPRPNCGNGLHGWLLGVGDVTVSGDKHSDPGSIWLVLKVNKADIVDLRGKVKFPTCEVVFTGNRDEAITEIVKYGAAQENIMYGTVTASGNYGKATASGNYGKATASGYNGTATASGDYGNATASGYGGTANASGYGGTANASGYNGTATASGNYGKASAGPNGSITLSYYDGTRSRTITVYVGENGIEPNVLYTISGGKLIKA